MCSRMLSSILIVVAGPTLSFAQAGVYDIGSSNNGVPVIIPYGTPAARGMSGSALSGPSQAVPGVIIASSIDTGPPNAVTVLDSALQTFAVSTPNAYGVLTAALSTFPSMILPTAFPILPPPTIVTTPVSASTQPTASGPVVVSSSAPVQSSSLSPTNGQPTGIIIPPGVQTSSRPGSPAGSATIGSSSRSLSSSVVTETITETAPSSSSSMAPLATETMTTPTGTALGPLLSTQTTRVITSVSTTPRPATSTSALASSNSNKPSESGSGSRTLVTSATSGTATSNPRQGINPGVQPATTTAAPAVTGAASTQQFSFAAGGIMAAFLGLSAL